MVDVDGVVVHAPDGRRWDADLEADLGIAPADLQEKFFRAGFQEVSLGRRDLFEHLERTLPTFAPHLTPRALVDYWFARDSRLNEALLAELAALRAQGIALHLASVQEHHRARYLWETVGFRDRFDAFHYAADLGCAKPDPAFFEKAQARSGFAAHELMLIDDAPANVAGAKAAGWRAALWDGSSTLAEVLRTHA
jgi:putative hydrolase of the HAD superfamily